MTLTNLTYEQQAMLMQAEKVLAERDRLREQNDHYRALIREYADAWRSGDRTWEGIARSPLLAMAPDVSDRP